MGVYSFLSRVASALKSTSRTDSLGETVIVFAVASSTGAIIALAAKGIADVGDLLGFLGAAVGAFLAVGGAVWIEHWKRRTAYKHKYDGLRKVVAQFKSRYERDLKLEFRDQFKAAAAVDLIVDYSIALHDYVQRSCNDAEDINVIRISYWLRNDLNTLSSRLKEVHSNLQESGDSRYFEEFKSQYDLVVPALRSMIRTIDEVGD